MKFFKTLKKKIIGRGEKVDFPELGLAGVSAKIDTGAYSSTIHVYSAEVQNTNDAEELVCHFYPKGHKQRENGGYVFKQFKRKKVKSSNGEAEVRFLVKLKIVVLGEKYTTDFTLSNRKKLKHPVLLGRKLLRGRFIVDIALKNQPQNIK